MYEQVMSRVLSSTTSTSQTEALLELDVPKRTFERKRSIAELIFDRPEFDKLVDELAKTSSRQRNIRLEKMIADCSKIFERPEKNLSLMLIYDLMYVIYLFIH